MKNSFRVKVALATGALLLATSTFVIAQTPGGLPGMDAAMMRLFGENKSFTTDVEISMLDGVGKTNLSMTLTMAQLNGQIRTEVDMEKATGDMLAPEMRQQMKSMGMSRIITLVKPTEKMITMIYPGLTSLLQIPLPKDQVDALSKEPKMEKTELGKETLSGHACVKSKVTVTDDSGQKQDFLLWAASDMKNFPIRIESTTPQGKMVVNYKNAKLERPDAKLFEPPSGYNKFASQEELQVMLMKKMMGGAQQ